MIGAKSTRSRAPASRPAVCVGIIFLLFSSFFAGDCFAEVEPASGWYVRGDWGFSMARDPELTIPEGPLPADLGESTVFGAGLGQSFVSGLRYDFTLTYRSGFEQVSGFPDMPEGRAEFQSLLALASLYLDVYPTGRISPYVGVGLGISRNELGTVHITNPDGTPLGTIDGKAKNNYAWQMCAGFRTDVTTHWMLDGGYRFLSAGDYESEGTLVFIDGATAPGKDEARFKSHEFVFSIIYSF